MKNRRRRHTKYAPRRPAAAHTEAALNGGVLSGAAPGPQALQQALQAQPDGPNVAPSLFEAEAAAGEPHVPSPPDDSVADDRP